MRTVNRRWWMGGSVLVVVGLLLSNPDQARFEAHVSRHLQARMAAEGADTTVVGRFAAVVARGLATAYAGANTTRTNCGLFSIYVLDLSTMRLFTDDLPPSLRFLGVAGTFVPLD